MATKKASKPIVLKHSSSNTPSLALWLCLAVIVVLIDQFSKVLIVGYYKLGEVTTITSFFNITRHHNPGAAFSFLAGAGGWQRWFFTGIAAVATVFITYLLSRHANQRLFAFSLTLILGGAVGNLIDRLWHGYVVDMISVHWGGWYFPVFNIADSAITLGAVCLILDEILRVRRGG
jgi:signal peptidase II